MSKDQSTYNHFYGRADNPSQLPWHREEIPPFLEKAATGGKALDIGCGTGVFSVYLAKRGMKVTSLDYMAKAIEFTRSHAASNGVELEAVQADITQWKTHDRFDLILDSGCLHGLSDEQRVLYKQQLLTWLSERGSYILLHFGKRNFLDWSPVGPRRMRRADIEGFFSPELRLEDYQTEIRKGGAPGLLGSTTRIDHYWFRGGP